MKFPIYLHQADSGSFSGFVPDITGCYFAGETIDAAIADAWSAIDAHLDYVTEKCSAPAARVRQIGRAHV